MISKIKSSLFHGINYSKRYVYSKKPLSLLLPKPQSIYLIPFYKCNSRCIMCLNWKKKENSILSFNQWKQIIDNLKQWCNSYVKVNISGGEILAIGIMKEAANYCLTKFPLTGITSNGFLIDQQEARQLIQKEFSNINVSIDGYNPKTVNLIRGLPYAYTQSRKAVEYLIQEKKRQKSNTKIIIKTIIMGLNLQELPSLVQWVKEIQADGIYFQPIEPIYASKQTYEELKKSILWINRGDKNKAIKIINQLKQMKKTRYPILNDLDNLDMLKDYFELMACKTKPTFSMCDIDTTSLFIYPNGDIFFCPKYPPIGNLINDKIKNIMSLKNTIKQRNQIRSCNRIYDCLSTCMVKKSFFQLIELFLFLNK